MLWSPATTPTASEVLVIESRTPAVNRIAEVPAPDLRVAVIGMGYVGITLASVLAMLDFRVYGVEVNSDVVRTMSAGDLHLFEPGVDEALAGHLGANWSVSEVLPEPPDVAIICVGTPMGPERRPNLDFVRSATEALAERATRDTLVILRSTVPVGTTRDLVHRLLEARHPGIRVAHCPERTIQGQALREIRELPQVIGPMDEASGRAAAAFFGRFAPRLVPVSSPETSELVKLANNAHTDVIYGFGNELAMIAGARGLDPLEVIRAANLDYPRPDLAKPGFVGGGCLTKDPYILMSSVEDKYQPLLVSAARHLNETMPVVAAEELLALMRAREIDPRGAKVLVCGFAYKGRPPTDDTRGTAAIEVVATLREAGAQVVGHDFLVPAAYIRATGAEPVALADGFRGADAAIMLIDHMDYLSMDLDGLLSSAHRPFAFYDAWRIFRENPALRDPQVTYGGLGSRP